MTTQMETRPSAAASRWPLERVLFAMAGTMTLISAALAALVSPWFLLLTAFVGISQWLYVTVRNCPASLVLKRFGFTPQCRW
jgi:4-hydroxybenzoate polyprenyltransferase